MTAADNGRHGSAQGWFCQCTDAARGAWTAVANLWAPARARAIPFGCLTRTLAPQGQKAFTSSRISRSAVRVHASAEHSGELRAALALATQCGDARGTASTAPSSRRAAGMDASRRQVLQLAAIPALSGLLPSAALAAGGKRE